MSLQGHLLTSLATGLMLKTCCCADECQEALRALAEAKRLDLGEMAKEAQANSSGLRSPPGCELLSAEEAFFW